MCRIIESGPTGQGFGHVLQLDPRSTACVPLGPLHCHWRLERENSQEQHEERILRLVVDSHSHVLLRPDMLLGEAKSPAGIIKNHHRFQPGKGVEGDAQRSRGGSKKLRVPHCLCRLQELRLLMLPRRSQQKLGMGGLELPVRLMDSTLAKKKRLATFTQGFDDAGPFLQGMSGSDGGHALDCKA